MLLLVAIVGSVLLARTTKQESAVDDAGPQALERESGVEGDARPAQAPRLTDDETQTGAENL